MKTAEKIFKIISLSIFGLALFLGAIMYFGNFENYITTENSKTEIDNGDINISIFIDESNSRGDIANLSQILIVLSQVAIIFGTLSSNIGRVFDRAEVKRDIIKIDAEIKNIGKEITFSERYREELVRCGNRSTIIATMPFQNLETEHIYEINDLYFSFKEKQNEK
jgi:hypothetical protein